MNDKRMAKELFHISNNSFTEKSPWTKEQFLSFLNSEHHFFFTIEISGCIVGFILFSLICEEVDILLIAVKKEHQRQGFGQLLLEKCVHFTIESKAKDIFIEVRKSNKVAQYFYDKNDFKELAIRKKYYKHPTEDAIVLKLSV